MNKNVVACVIRHASRDAIENALNVVIEHFAKTYDYENRKLDNLLGILCGEKPCDKEDIDTTYIRENINNFMYKAENYAFGKLSVEDIDNFEGCVRLSIERIEKLNEDRGDVSYEDYKFTVSYLDSPSILMKK